MIVAIDGPAGSGKSTVAKRLAQKLGFLYLDTGAMYRAIGWLSKTAGYQLNNLAQSAEKIADLAASASIEMLPQKHPGALTQVICNEQDVTDKIREHSIDLYASAVATIAQVRELLVEKQREIISSQPHVVLEGRDTTTVVCPKADLKIFLSAESSTRALRRVKERHPRLAQLTDEEIVKTPKYKRTLEEVERRDYQDSHRAESPLCVSKDAVVLDSSHMDIDEVVAKIAQLIKERCV